MGVGSYASPGWFTLSQRRIREGDLGPGDIDELFEDATRIAIADQVEAGVDIVTDGELRRQRFVYEMFDRLSGLKRVPARRKLGVPFYDMAPGFTLEGELAAPGGLGVVAEFEALRRLAPGRALKVAIPGPLTFAGPIVPPKGHEGATLDRLGEIVRDELGRLVAAGADYIQLDEPGFAEPPYGLSFAEAALMINRAIEGLDARIAVHVCFGNNAGRPKRPRAMRPLMDGMVTLACHQLVLEFANREMADLDLLSELSQRFEIAAGVVDVKSFHIESPAEVAARIERCLDHVQPERLTVTADCGFSALPRFLARAKMQAMVEGARLVRARLASS
jgi:5-methyltetrahydropteroyltriglutamate--homocysteine methyltransferase